MVGKSVYFIFEEELQRLFEDLNQLRGNLWLFYSAGRLAQSGCGIDFIAESDARTPDYRATRAPLTVFVEANARSLSHTKIEGLPDILWKVIHGDANSGGKQIKFIDASIDQRNLIWVRDLSYDGRNRALFCASFVGGDFHGHSRERRQF